MRKSLAPLKLPGFRHLAGAYTVNELGNWVGEIALAVLVFDETGARSRPPRSSSGCISCRRSSVRE